MNMLSIAQAVAQEIGFEPPNYLIGNSDATARQLLALANREGRYLIGRHNWSVLQKTQNLQTITGQADYALPVDYHHLLADSFWDYTNRRKVIGPIDIRQWQRIKASGIGASIGYRYRVALSGVSNKIQLEPVPSNNADLLVYVYISKLWAVDDGLLVDEISSDSTTTLLPVDLLQLGMTWRFLQAKGLDAALSRAEYEQELAAAIARDTNLPGFGGQSNHAYLGPYSLVEGNFGQ
jgi:hypothetical protein